jgi:hypothetical protein
MAICLRGGWADPLLNPTGSIVQDFIYFRVETVADMAPMTVAGSQQFACFVGSLGLNAPLLDPRHTHVGVK